MRVLLTGGTGFIGSSIAKRLLSEGNEIALIVRPSSKLTLLEDIKDKVTLIVDQGDIYSLADAMKEFKGDVLIHLASLFIAEHKTDDVDNILESNIRFPTHLLEAMKLAGIKKIINTASSWQNYNNEEFNPVCLYASTKEAFEDIIRFYVEAEGFSCITLTIYDSFGFGDNRRKIINLFKRIADSGESLDMSGGEQKINLVYIDDIVSAYSIALNMIKDFEKENKKYFLRTNEFLSLREIAATYSKVNNVKLNINWGLRPYRKREVMVPYENGEILPGWNPQYTLEKGLIKMREAELNNK